MLTKEHAVVRLIIMFKQWVLRIISVCISEGTVIHSLKINHTSMQTSMSAIVTMTAIRTVPILLDHICVAAVMDSNSAIIKEAVMVCLQSLHDTALFCSLDRILVQCNTITNLLHTF